MSGAIATENRPKDAPTGWVGSSDSTLGLQCPVCLAEVGAIEPQLADAASCPECGFTIAKENGTWRALAPERVSRFERFMAEYQLVRKHEGRGSANPNFYLSLPSGDPTGRNAWQWRIRSRSFECFRQKILPVVELRYARSLQILDIGAGNGWLSYRLAQRGHFPVAVDLLDNEEDGLGAAKHYFPHLERPFPRFQAEMDRLPFSAAQFDVAIFNASFHYSEDYERTLGEAMRCLKPSGHVFIIDSPFYSADKSGRQMVVEKHGRFEAQYGFPSDGVASREYLTPEILLRIEQACQLKWQTIKPWHGVSWELRPWKARLLGRREPSKFFIFWATVGEP